MKPGKVLSGGLLLAVLSMSACMNIPGEMTVAEYCANPKKAAENVCRLKVEIDGTSTALASTDMRLADALKLTANAQATADSAKADAAAAYAKAEEALANKMVCETTTVQKSSVGTCREGYTLTSCSQTRYTYRAGGPSILREINDAQCRFNDRVLEMQVRCCGTASSVPQPENAVVDAGQAETYAPAKAPEVTPAPVSP